MSNYHRVATILVVTLVLLVCFFGGLYFVGMRGEAYNAAVRFISENKIVEDSIGPLKGSRLALFGYSVNYNGPHGWAEYEIVVWGEKNKGSAYLDLEKSAGVWEVRKGNLVLENGVIVGLPSVPAKSP